MKRVLALFLTAFLLFVFVACGESTKSKYEDEDNDEGEDVVFKESEESTEIEETYFDEKDEIDEHIGVKLEGEIATASDFSEGLALVTLVGESGKTYCINKDGCIVFEINGYESYVNYGDSGFANGFALINNAIYDKTGKCTQPCDVGVTNFYDYALKDGYIIAEILTSTYSSSKKELGVMNTSFEWIVEPSEEFHSLFANKRGDIDETVKNYCSGIIYLCDKEIYVDVLTGKETSVPSLDPPSNIWTGWQNGDRFYYAYNDASGEKVMLDLVDVPNIMRTGSFRDGITTLAFYNPDSKKYYFTLINEKGEFSFEPIEFALGNLGLHTLTYGDGFVIVSDNKSYVKSYNTAGELIGEMEIDNGSFEISDGVVKMWQTNLYGAFRNYYYNPDFTPLF